MNSSNHSLSLTQRLQEKLDAAVQSPQGFSKGADKPYPNVISESGDDTASDLSGSISSARDLDDKGDNENVIKCSYRNFSQVLPDKADGPSSLIAQSSTAKEPTFPVKLHMILSNPEFQDIISWLPHGRSWRILQQKAFEERVIPLYFRHGRYSSFARQVNGWGFRRVTHGSDYNSYYHEMFLRGMPHLCEKMRRLTNKDTAARKKAEDEPAPDFYALSRVYPLPDSAPARPNPIRANANPAQGLLDVETALLERRRADLLERVNLLAASSNALRPDALTSLSMSQGGAAGMLRPGMMFDHSLAAAASPAPQPSLQPALQQLLAARQAGPDMTHLLAMNNAAAGMGAPSAMGMGAGMAAGMGGMGMGAAGMGAGMGIGGMPNFVSGSFNL